MHAPIMLAFCMHTKTEERLKRVVHTVCYLWEASTLVLASVLDMALIKPVRHQQVCVQLLVLPLMQ